MDISLSLPDDLIRPAEDILDPAALRRELEAIRRDEGDPARARAAVVARLNSARTEGMERIAEAFAADPFAARKTTRAYTFVTDCIIREVLEQGRASLTEDQREALGDFAICAVGGYGRGEMAPFSDVDLLFLTKSRITPALEALIEAMLYVMWDLHLKVGHASRTIRECLKLGGEDYTIRTSLMETRFLAGDAPLVDQLNEKLWSDLFKGTEKDFIEAKLEERFNRHQKQGGQRYVVEPNVKEGKGGLRDLQSLYWIGKYVHGVQSVAELVRLGVFTRDEYATFHKAEDFLWAVRCHLHLLAGRPQDQLTFDMQVQVAERMGYKDKGGRRGVEHFMQAYFRHANSVGELTRIFLTQLEAENVKGDAMLERVFRRKPKIGSDYKVVHGRLAVKDEAHFLQDKLNLLRLFDEGLRTGMLLHADAMRMVHANLDRIDDQMREDPEAAKIFLGTLLKHGNPERALRRMNELGLLGTFLPEFGQIVAMMQFNMYHHYTVDEHTIQCIRHLALIEHGDLEEELPVASTILAEGVNRRVLYVALLLHDIGKGREEDHAVLGAKIARKVAPRLGLTPEECDTVEWLVRYHLLMSDMAQKRDLADPRTVRDFAKAVRSRDRLDLLTVLTVCDIRGVGPGTWNNWKAQLLRTLYHQTRRALETGLEELNRTHRGQEAQRMLVEKLDGWSQEDVDRELARHYPPYWQGLQTATQAAFAEMLRDLPVDEIRIDLHADEDRDATRALFAMADHPGIFARLSGALALVGANVVDARTYTTVDGYATAAFWVQDAEGSPYEASRLPRLTQMIHKILRGELVAREAMVDRDRIKKRERAFKVATSVAFDNEGSEIYTIIEVDTRDRVGLLYDLTRTLATANVQISSAVIATYGEQVVDTFYVKDMFGLKLFSASKQKALEAKLREAIAAGQERARA
ncbi:Bifunctional uridylyltransferase/uridylyl-removing enzyme [Pseudooceanicola marinus]|uniref:Bifunctional uridylyltransferase/uridylyl-removing enzyme n=1 Tax=Pseudooceanicola marinus TaxID=396013 RepID=A0A1X6Z1H7_9RHOB|nr:[protein-PII] uridylyltransferase [Pseudooceanicola marinus]PJE32399.1 [protein-PII] uridylyltransferase [Pseudooceanicola marinus]SLN38142.1 Bifunctional uridylyltransferase/uridylyl-removing enzyme [Pseudooceanicola marinus]